MNATERLTRQIGFVLEAEKLKAVLRRTSPVGAERRENSAEHSWTLALMAVLLAEHSNRPVDLDRVLQMILVHDLVEIDAGDTFHYDAAAVATKAERETRAAERIFGLLPDEQGLELRRLWNEFEAGRTAEARFAGALDRLAPMLQNFHNAGGSWLRHGVTSQQVTERNGNIVLGSERLWEFAVELIREAEAKGFFAGDDAG